ncbi:hypothetical protein EV188_1194 [Actinomycetospora succinea]|uniref:Uncharacterized protein n=1 Tax=Actinomycetospora succinea TaxID=663603 RepID=A0A4R6UGK3_9PSEU|nr:DUF6247 family protein [Actinomycetospora succinea]TDQ45941.1 hypothetical protein EV188_1194 [Actinomycetospora succinea]
MTTAASPVPPGGGDAGTWAEATPAEVRAVLAPESAVEFDRQWRAALARAADTYDLTIVLQCLDAWRRVARVTAAAGGAEGYRALLDAAATARAGEGPASPRAPWREVRADLGL